MNAFTHHNTSVNVIDVIIEKPGYVFPKTKINITRSKTLDDNVDLPDEEMNDQDLTKQAPQTNVVHPGDMKFVLVLLDDYSHLTEDVQPAVKM